MREYLVVIFYGIIATFLYNYFASLLRAIGDSATPLIFLAVSAVLGLAGALMLRASVLFAGYYEPIIF